MSSKQEITNPVIRWVDERLPVFSYMQHEYRDFPMPKNLNYFWNFGALASVCLVVMIVTGIILSMHYTAHVDHAFDSVERIMRDVNYGWLIRYIHMNGASMFFIVVYIHIFRSFYYGSYKAPREIIWMLGIIILLLMMGTAFMGYVLPWGQMSFWGATVITNLFSAIPIIGDPIVTWLWGGFSVDNATLNRFFSLHFLLPFVIFGVVGLHVVAIHIAGSNNPDGIDVKPGRDTVPFTPYFTAKDSVGLIAFILIYALFVFYLPNYMGHADNYIEANSLSTPAHIVPEWYFLPFYAMLRAITFEFFWLIPAKLGGVLTMFGSIGVLFIVPWLDTSRVRSCRYRPIYKWFIWILIADCVLLGFCGAAPAEGMWLYISQAGTAYYFFHFLILLPILGKLETPLSLPTSISEPVTGGGGSAAAGATAAKMEKK